MKPKTIGIVGGAGPLAGALLFERVLTLANRQYDCYRDSDYPEVLVISFPFSEMLTSKKDDALLTKELSQCLNHLRDQGAEVLGIACNTLHNFLDPKDDQDDLLHLPRLVANELTVEEIPLVLCTTTSRKFQMHRSFFACVYPDDVIQ